MASIIPAAFTLTLITDEVAAFMGLGAVLGIVVLVIAFKLIPKVIRTLKMIAR